MEFEWDPAKDKLNAEKHGIAFDDAKEMFRDPQLLIEDASRAEHGERRSKAIGRLDSVIVAVIFTDRGDRRRIISVTRARRDEQEQYRHSAEIA